MESLTREPVRLSRRNSIDAQTVLPVFLATLLLTAAIAAGDVVLVRLVHRHRSETAAHLFNDGARARDNGRRHEALELFRKALNENPASTNYALAFAQALRSVSRVRKAQAALERLLDSHPANGPASAELARILAAEGDWRIASWYYHRSLYGDWREESERRKLRFELANLLAKHGAREELLAEILLLTATPLTPSETRQLAQLFMAAEDWPRAEREYRALLRDKPDDPNLLTGLARAQAGSGRYLAAERTYRRTKEGLSPTAQKELALLASVNSLNPTLRRLDAAEKHGRAHELAQRLIDALRACSPAVGVVAEVELSLARHRRPRNAAAAADADLDSFELLWAVRGHLCAAVTLPRELELLGAEIEK